jgi:ADP-ribose pyrophosphatase
MNYRLEILDKKPRYRGFLTVHQYRLRHELFAGGWSPEIMRECLDRGHAVAVLPYDPGRDEVVLIEQFRIGALGMSSGAWLLEIVAGMIEAGEGKSEVARREAVEEAGCELRELVPICEYLNSAGGSSETIALYCGRVDASGVGGIHGSPAEHEDIRVHVLPRVEAFDLLRQGGIVSAAPIIALQWLALNHEQLRERWLNAAR